MANFAPVDKIAFEWMGLRLLEPMSLIMNWLISLQCLIYFFRLPKNSSPFIYWWRGFFLFFGISTIFGGLGHLLFNYFDIYGKIPCWTIGIVGGYCAARGVLSCFKPGIVERRLLFFLVLKCVVLWFLGIMTLKFLFISLDASISYLVFCGFVGFFLYREGIVPLKYTVIGVLILLPSVFIFGFEINIHPWFNKDDFSHVLMIGCIYYFYLGAKNMLSFTRIALD